MKAFHNDQAVKDLYINRVKAHVIADEIIKGQYWNEGKGCAVGCTIHDSDHAKYESELGIPEWLARVEDTIFEGLSNQRAKSWPVEFLSSINLGANLEGIKNDFLIFILESNLKTLDLCNYEEKDFPAIKESIKLTKSATIQMIEALKQNDPTAINAASSAAYSAASFAASSAAWSAAYSAASFAASSAARSAARSAASSAEWSAARSAASSAAWSAAYEKFADKLLDLLKGCK